METDLYKKALTICIDAHDEQTRYDGTAYFYHPLAVCMSVSTETEKVIALLHDVLEDTEITTDMLIDEGIPHHIVKDLETLTHREDEGYYEYILRVGQEGSEEAIWVKYQDIEHNLLTTKGKHRIGKYKLAQFVLMDFLINNF